jgi:hypothetical protein
MPLLLPGTARQFWQFRMAVFHLTNCASFAWREMSKALAQAVSATEELTFSHSNQIHTLSLQSLIASPM